MSLLFGPKPLAADVRPTVSAGGERQGGAYSSVTIPCTANVTGLSEPFLAPAERKLAQIDRPAVEQQYLSVQLLRGMIEGMYLIRII